MNYTYSVSGGGSGRYLTTEGNLLKMWCEKHHIFRDSESKKVATVKCDVGDIMLPLLKESGDLKLQIAAAKIEGAKQAILFACYFEGKDLQSVAVIEKLTKQVVNDLQLDITDFQFND